MSQLHLFNYELPEELVAARPTRRRDESRLLCLHRASGRVEHSRFGDIVELVRSGDVLVVNDARVIPARLVARRRTGGRVELLLVRPEEPEAEQGWLAMLKTGGDLRPGELLRLEGAQAELRLCQKREGGYWSVAVATAGTSMQEVLRRGKMPLPPYIRKARRRLGMPEELPELDRERYQTIFGRAPGAVAAPTAGLHFTQDLLADLCRRGVQVRPLTLLVGPGTFRPVRTDQVENHHLEPEFYRLPGQTAAAVRRALREGKRVIATGTTCCRVLEYVAREARWQEHAGWTDLYIYPPFEFRVVGALITNFHLPCSTVLMLVCAFAGRQQVLQAYRVAVEERYRFYSYGDAMFIY